MDRTADLLDQLRRYIPVDLTEEKHRSDLVDLLANGDPAFARSTFAPGHITASCFIVDASQSRLLLHRHRRLGRWLQMGGHVDSNERAVEAALREGREESGLADLELLERRFIDVDVHEIPAGRGEPAHRHFDVRYLATTAAPDSIRIAADESDDLVWIDLLRAAELMNEPASSRVVKKIERFLA